MTPLQKSNQPTIYCIKVQGVLDETWADWLGGMQVTYEAQGNAPPITTLAGPISDQAALRGILNTLWDLNLVLLSVYIHESQEAIPEKM
jgi:hypothetical protein